MPPKTKKSTKIMGARQLHEQNIKRYGVSVSYLDRERLFGSAALVAGYLNKGYHQVKPMLAQSSSLRNGLENWWSWQTDRFGMDKPLGKTSANLLDILNFVQPGKYTRDTEKMLESNVAALDKPELMEKLPDLLSLSTNPKERAKWANVLVATYLLERTPGFPIDKRTRSEVSRHLGYSGETGAGLGPRWGFKHGK